MFYIISEISFKFSSAIKACSSSFFIFFTISCHLVTQILWKQALKKHIEKSVLKVWHVYTTQLAHTESWSALIFMGNFWCHQCHKGFPGARDCVYCKREFRCLPPNQVPCLRPKCTCIRKMSQDSGRQRWGFVCNMAPAKGTFLSFNTDLRKYLISRLRHNTDDIRVHKISFFFVFGYPTGWPCQIFICCRSQFVVSVAPKILFCVPSLSDRNEVMPKQSRWFPRWSVFCVQLYIRLHILNDLERDFGYWFTLGENPTFR